MRTKVLRSVCEWGVCGGVGRCGAWELGWPRGEATSTPGGERGGAESLGVGAGLGGVSARWPQFSLGVGGKVMW